MLSLIVENEFFNLMMKMYQTINSSGFRSKKFNENPRYIIALKVFYVELLFHLSTSCIEIKSINFYIDIL